MRLARRCLAGIAAGLLLSLSVQALSWLPTAGRALADAALFIDSEKGERWGWAIDYPSIAQAMQRAKRECGKECYPVMTFRSGCGAWAADQAEGSTALGWARAETRVEAEETALSWCRKHGGISNQCLVRVWGCNSIEESSRKQVGRKDRLVFVRIDLTIAETYRYGSSDWNRRVRFCGYTTMSYEEELAYSERLYGNTFSSDVTGKVIRTPHFFTAGYSGKPSRDRGNMDASPVMRRFRDRIMQHPYYGVRHVNPEYEETGLTRRGAFGAIYDGVMFAFKDPADYATFVKIECRYQPDRHQMVFKEAIDLGRF